MLAALHQFNQPCDAEFTLQLADLTVLKCQKVVRVIPQKRVVCQALWQSQHQANISQQSKNQQSQAVFAKIYLGTDANKYAQRELLGVQALKKAHILTPELLAESQFQQQPVLVFAAVLYAQNAEDFMRQQDFLARKSMAIKLAQAVAQHHAANLMQTDIHLKNFLIAGENVYTIDGDGIKSVLNARQKMRNLAMFLSKFDALDDDFMQTSVEAYCAALGVTFKVENFHQTYFLAQNIRRQTASHYADKKVFRTCTDVSVTQNKQLFLAVSSQFFIETKQQNQYFNNLDQYLTVSESNFKNGNTCTVGLAEINHKKVVIKRYNIKSWWHGLMLRIKKSRAAISWANAHRLQIYNIATPQPLALVSQKNGSVKVSYFVSEFIDGPDATEFFAQTQNAEVINRMAMLFYKLFLLQLSHGDTKASNFKIVDNQPMLIDLDSMCQHKWAFFAQKAHVRDLKRFMQNWQNTPALYNAFIRAFYVVYDDTTPLQMAGFTRD